jgi:hypothetical protein
LDILRYTTGRREDALRLGPQHIRDGRVCFRQAKNEHRNPIKIDIPLHSALAASIAAARVGNMAFSITKYGKPFYRERFRQQIQGMVSASGFAQLLSAWS